MENVVVIFVLILITVFAHILNNRTKRTTYAGLKYEDIGQKMYSILLKKDPELNFDKARLIVHSVLDEKWFMRLKRYQVDEIYSLINECLNDNKDDISESRLNQIVNNFKQQNNVVR